MRNSITQYLGYFVIKYFIYSSICFCRTDTEWYWSIESVIYGSAILMIFPLSELLILSIPTILTLSKYKTNKAFVILFIPIFICEVLLFNKLTSGQLCNESLFKVMVSILTLMAVVLSSTKLVDK